MLEPIPMIVFGLFILVSISFYAIVFVLLLRISNRLQETADSTPTLRPFQRPELRRDRAEHSLNRQDNRPRNTDREQDRSRNHMRGNNMMRNKLHPQRTQGGNPGNPGNQGNSGRRPFESQPRPQAAQRPAMREEPVATRPESAPVTPVTAAPAPMAASAVDAVATETHSSNEVRHGRRIQIKRRNMTLETKADGQQTASPEPQTAPVVEENSTPVVMAEAGSSKQEEKTIEPSVNNTI